KASVLLPDNSQITSVSFDITGPETRHGMVQVGGSRKLGFRVDALRVSTDPYLIVLSATTSAGVACHGQQSFLIATNQLTSLTMSLSCDDDRDERGDLQVRADVAGNCPTITGISALPAETAVGSDVALHVSHTAGATGRVTWTAIGGTVSPDDSADAMFLCL